MRQLQTLLCCGLLAGGMCQGEEMSFRPAPVIYTVSSPSQVLETPQTSIAPFLSKIRTVVYQEGIEPPLVPQPVEYDALPSVDASSEPVQSEIAGVPVLTRLAQADERLSGSAPAEAPGESGDATSAIEDAPAASETDSVHAPIDYTGCGEGCGEAGFGSGCGEACFGSGCGECCPEFLTCLCDDKYNTVTVYGGAMFLKRADPRGQLLFVNPFNRQEHIKAGDYNFGVQSGFETGVIAHDLLGCQRDLEVRFFQIDDWTDTVDRTLTGSVSRINTAPWVDVPGPRPVLTGYASRLMNLEANMRHRIGGGCEWLTVITGFRYIGLAESITGSLVDSSGTAPTAGVRVDADNRLYGLQVGLNGTICGTTRACLEGFGRAGVYGNDSSANRIQSVSVASRSAGDASTAFVGEIGVKGRYRLTHNVNLYGRYQVLILDGVALASDQFTSSHTADSTLWFHGATFGMEFVY